MLSQFLAGKIPQIGDHLRTIDSNPVWWKEFYFKPLAVHGYLKNEMWKLYKIEEIVIWKKSLRVKKQCSECFNGAK